MLNSIKRETKKTFMKRLTLALFMLVGVQMMAQEGPKISSAIISIDRNNDLPQAKQYIDEAAQIISTKPVSEISSKDLSKFYYYKGLINFRIYNSDKAEIKALDPKALDKAAEGFRDLIKHEQQTGKERYTDETKGQIPFVANAYAQRGIDKSTQKDYQGAYEDFMLTYEMKKQPPLSQTDTAMIYNAAIMAQNGEMYDKAIDLNKKLIDMGYRSRVYKATDAESGQVIEFPSKKQMDFAVKSGGYTNPTVEGDIRADLYVTLTALYLKNGDTAKYDQYVAEGRQKFPENQKLLMSELQKFFENKEYDKAMVNLNQAIAKDPDNVVMHYNKGVILQNQMKEYDKALEAYQQALKVDSTYSDAMYMSSIIYIDRANEIVKQMNELPLNATTKYKELQKKQTEVFQQALPFLEKAHKFNPDDEQVTTALVQVYRALKMYEKAKALQD